MCPRFCPFFLIAVLFYCRLSDPLQYQSIVDAEWNIIYDKLDKCVNSGAKICFLGWQLVLLQHKYVLSLQIVVLLAL